MTSDLAFTAFRMGFLVLLWLLIFAMVATLRRDIYGTVVTPRGSGRNKVDREKKKQRKKAKNHKAKGAPSKLLITGGPLTGTLLPLGASSITIGRSPSATLVLEDPYVSTWHAELVNQDGTWILVDKGSTNGSFVDDERVLEPRPLDANVTARIGQTTFELVT